MSFRNILTVRTTQEQKETICRFLYYAFFYMIIRMLYYFGWWLNHHSSRQLDKKCESLIGIIFAFDILDISLLAKIEFDSNNNHYSSRKIYNCLLHRHKSVTTATAKSLSIFYFRRIKSTTMLRIPGFGSRPILLLTDYIFLLQAFKM